MRHLTSVRALRDGGHRTVLRLDPEHLGEVTVTVDVRGADVRMAVSGGAEALAALRDGLGHLRSSLAASGLDLGDVALHPDASAAAPPVTGSAGAAAPTTGTTGGTSGPGGDTSAGGRSAGSAGAPDGRRAPQDQGTPAVPAAAPPTARAGRTTAPDAAGAAPARRLDVRV